VRRGAHTFLLQILKFQPMTQYFVHTIQRWQQLLFFALQYCETIFFFVQIEKVLDIDICDSLFVAVVVIVSFFGLISF